ncbi:unnamed protein product [Allacma fusca]|uniref:Uncharacterized protein n=1 Tax=Allacma fusca TaxID=39272 RepID=A0A8J2KAS1_9HEXA|nr:unnamed protein product [Allacma fusca]
MSTVEIVTPAMREELKRCFTIGVFIQANPYNWDEGENLPKNVTSKFKLSLFWINVFISSACAMFSIFRCGQIFFDDLSPFWLKMYMPFSCVVITAVPIFYLVTAYNRREFLGFMRRLTRFLELYAVTHTPADCSVRENLTRLVPISIRFLRLAVATNCTVYTLNAVFRPDSPEFILSICPQGNYYYLARIIHYIVLVVYVTVHRSVVTLVLSSFFFFTCPMFIVLEEIR